MKLPSLQVQPQFCSMDNFEKVTNTRSILLNRKKKEISLINFSLTDNMQLQFCLVHMVVATRMFQCTFGF